MEMPSQPGARACRPSRRQLAVRACGAAGVLTLGLGLWVVAGSGRATDSLNAKARDSSGPPIVQSPPPVSIAPKPVERAVRSGETLGEVFAELGLEGGEAGAAVDAIRPYVDPRKIRPGDLLLASYGHQEELVGVELRVPRRGTVALAKQESGWRTTWRPVEREVLPQVISGTLVGSLEGAIEEAGADGLLAYEMADVLQWDLDFSRDLRVGDTFQVYFEEAFLDGQYDSIAGIVAVRYANRGKVISAYRFGEAGGYYDAEGRPLKKMFLRSPLRFSRVTSKFSHRRFHPVLHTFRPHYGVDYGAPTGTPVMVTAHGTVTFAGWDRGGGKTVKVRHPGGYLTAYLHLSRFAEGTRPGRSVQQGEIVGFVGSTGLATAPHLDYRVSLNGTWIDPLSLTTVPARPLNGVELAQFKLARQTFDLGMAAGQPQRRIPGGLPIEAGATSADAVSARR